MAAYTYPLSEIRTRVRDILNESTATFWTDAELTAYINDGVRAIAEIGRCIQTINTTAATVNGTRTVAFTGYSVEAVLYQPSSGTEKALVKTDELRFGRLQSNGTYPQFFAETGQYVAIEPIPDAAYNLDIYYYAAPTDMSGDADVPSVPLAYRQLIILYALYRAYMKERSFGAGMQCYQMFMNELAFEAMDIPVNVPNSKEEYIFSERR